jgi:hypothetical protein
MVATPKYGVQGGSNPPCTPYFVPHVPGNNCLPADRRDLGVVFLNELLDWRLLVDNILIDGSILVVNTRG